MQRPWIAWRRPKRLVLAAAMAGAVLAAACGGPPADLPTLEVQPGGFLVTVIQSGEVQAVRGDVIVSPRIGGSLKIIYLFPEGEMVDVGDLVLQFDPAEFEKEMLDREGQLEEAVADHARAQAQREQTLADLKRQIQQQQAQYELAVLNLQRQRLGSRIDSSQAAIQLEKAQRALADARADSTAQEVVNRVDLQELERRISRARERYEHAKEEFERTKVYATRPGIVVYRKIWKRGTDEQTKVSVGDEIWGGRALMDIPDLSEMQVMCLIGEMDLKLMQVGQEAFIRLEAFAGPVFHGRVTSLAPMATPQPGAPDIRVFEMIVRIEEQDERLKPGMSAEVEVVTNAVADVISVPLDAISEAEGKAVVYRLEGRSLRATEVTLGQRNAVEVVIESGLSPGDVIAREPPGQ